PEYKYSCYYGVDTSSSEELLLNRMSLEEAKVYIEADSLAFLSEGALYKSGDRDDLCTACFTAEYPTNLYGAEPKKRCEKCK
ncbi:MAG: amidophosphoribosyltransferase, partial [Rikenellaceae bacterium]